MAAYGETRKATAIMGIIVVEGGGTRTSAALYDDTGVVSAERRGGPSNPSSYGVPAAANCIGALISELLNSTDTSGTRIYIALAGAASTGIRSAIADALAAMIPAARIWITTDLHALLHANAGSGPGLLVIAGTGAAVLARDASGNMLRTGGWGVLFGDEGSAYGVAAAALRACARACDGVGPETSLVTLLPTIAGLDIFDDFVAWQGCASKKDVAALASAVADAANQGDLIARSCLDEQARRLAALAIAAQERLGLDPATPLYEYGGLLENCDAFRLAFREALNQYADLRPLPCAVRGLEAVYALSRLETAPPWISVREADTPSDGTLLPNTEAAGGEKPIDALSTEEFVQHMHHANEEATAAVGLAGEAIAAAIEHAARCLRRGGRIIYAGAGTSGRLGVLDASECPPTFGVSPDRVRALIAGGDRALRFSVEGAEDDRNQGETEAKALNIREDDFVVGIAASGNTPYVDGVLSAAHAAGARTALVSSNRGATIGADLPIVLNTGPEILAGSTRLKAGTAAKMTLNMITTGAFSQAGYVFRGRMVGMTPANEKLRQRAARIVAELAGTTTARAEEALACSGYHIAASILMARRGLSPEEAEAVLRKHEGCLRDALTAEDGDNP